MACASPQSFVADGHAVRAVTRSEDGRARIEATGAECWIGSPDVVGTLRYALDNVTIVVWALGTACRSGRGGRRAARLAAGDDALQDDRHDRARGRLRGRREASRPRCSRPARASCGGSASATRFRTPCCAPTRRTHGPGPSPRAGRSTSCSASSGLPVVAVALAQRDEAHGLKPGALEAAGETADEHEILVAVAWRPARSTARRRRAVPPARAAPRRARSPRC